MNYEKLTLDKFADKLKAGDYKNLTGARRAIGKADWKEADKEKARSLAEKTFGAPEPKAEKKAAKKAVVKAAKAPKAAKAVEKAPREKKKVAQTVTTATGSLLAPRDFLRVQNLHVTTQIIGAATSALDALTRAKNTDSSLDITESQDIVNMICKAVRSLDQSVPSEAEAAAESAEVPVTGETTVSFSNGAGYDADTDSIFAPRPDAV